MAAPAGAVALIDQAVGDAIGGASWLLYQAYDFVAQEAAKADVLIVRAASLVAKLGVRVLVGTAVLMAGKVILDLAVEIARLQQQDPKLGGAKALWLALINRLTALVEWLQGLFGTTPAEPPASIRKRAISQVPVHEVPVNASNPHGVLAAERASADRFAADLAAALGGRLYHVQLSPSQHAAGKRGALHHWTYRDAFDVEVRPDPSPADVFYDRDDSYYRDMPAALAEDFQVHLIYAFVPERAARSATEYMYTFDHKQRVQLNITGGATYTHELWSWSSDRIYVLPKYPWRPTRVYQIERRRMGDDRQLIMAFPDVSISPVSRFCSWLGRMCTWGPFKDRFAGLAPLARFKPVVALTAPHVSLDYPKEVLEELPGFVEVTLNHFCRFRYQTEDGAVVSTALCGTYSSTTLSAEDDSFIVDAARLSGAHFNLATAASHCASATRTNLLPLTAYIKAGGTGDLPLVSYGTSQIVHYQYVNVVHGYDPAAKPSMTQLITPVIEGDVYAPSKTQGNVNHSIVTRCLEVASDARPTSAQLKHMDEFIASIAADAGVEPGTLEPVGVEEVEAQIHSANQRHAFTVWANSGTAKTDHQSRPATCFTKAEAYPEPKDPRNIVNIAADEKYDASRLWLAVAKVLKRQHWYSFVEPNDLEQRLMAKFSQSHQRRGGFSTPITTPLETDGSRWDGRVSVTLKLLEERLLLYLFHPRHHGAVRDELKRTNNKLIFFEDQWFVSVWSQESGRSATSSSNSVGNAFIAYDALRSHSEDPKHGPAYDKNDALDMLGQFGGDDAVQTLREGEDGTRYVEAAARLGMIFTCGDPKAEVFNFLGRAWNVHGERANSCIILRRALRNLSVTVGPCSNPEQKLREKLSALEITDSRTPGIKELVRLLGTGPRQPLTIESSYWAVQSESTGQRFTNEAAAWMTEESVCGLSTEQWGLYMRWVQGMTLPYLLQNKYSPLRVEMLPDLTSMPMSLPGKMVPLMAKPDASLDSKPLPSGVVEKDKQELDEETEEDTMRKCAECGKEKATTQFTKAQRANGPDGKCMKCTAKTAAANGSDYACRVCHNRKAATHFPDKQLAERAKDPACRECCAAMHERYEAEKTKKKESKAKDTSSGTGAKTKASGASSAETRKKKP